MQLHYIHLVEYHLEYRVEYLTEEPLYYAL